MIKWNGYQLILNEIENAASKVAGEVNLAAVVGKSDDAVYLIVETDDDVLKNKVLTDLEDSVEICYSEASNLYSFFSENYFWKSRSQIINFFDTRIK